MRNEQPQPQPQPQPQQPKRGRGQPSPIRDPEMRARHISLMSQIRAVRYKQRRITEDLDDITDGDMQAFPHIAALVEDARRRLASLDEQLARLQGELAAHDDLIAASRGKE